MLGGPTDRTQEGIRQALLALPYGSLWEHNFFDYTDCPVKRNDWPWLMPALQEDDEVAITQDDLDRQTSEIKKHIDLRRQGTQAQVAWLARAVKAHVDLRRQESQAQIDAQTREILAAIEGIGAVSGPTADAIAAKIADELAKRLLE